jgi:hypothetical protein
LGLDVVFPRTNQSPISISDAGQKEPITKNGDSFVGGINHICEHYFSRPIPTVERYTDKKENQIFLLYKEIQNGAVAKSYMRMGLLIYEEMRKYLTIYEEAVAPF